MDSRVFKLSLVEHSYAHAFIPRASSLGAYRNAGGLFLL